MSDNFSKASDKELKIGAVFTPIVWAEFAIEKFNIFDKWISGATIFDPTMGAGNILESLIIYGLKKGYSLEKLPIKNLFGNELNTSFYNSAILKFEKDFQTDMRKNFSNGDILLHKSINYDIIFGNPPWKNYADLPENYKLFIRNFFIEYELVKKGKDVLLGESRIDIASLIIQKSIKDFLKPKGEAIFFMPLSILLNEGANRNFRNYKVQETDFSIDSVYDFNKKIVFDGVKTRYGLTKFVRDTKFKFPIPYYIIANNSWKECVAQPYFENNDPLSIFNIVEEKNKHKILPISIKKESQPRQGINTCGANDVFIFNSLTCLENNLVLVSNKKQKDILLPKKFVYPLLTSENFKCESNKPLKWILLPYNKNGKPLNLEQINKFPELLNYLEKNKSKLISRKGVIINTNIRKGFWWALLGVGKYNFFPNKIVWEAYGKKTFEPKIFTGTWQANQALQAYIPIQKFHEAKKLLKELSNINIEKYLLSLKMPGTMNWAQPGKIKKFLKIND